MPAALWPYSKSMGKLSCRISKFLMNCCEDTCWAFSVPKSRRKLHHMVIELDTVWDIRSGPMHNAQKRSVGGEGCDRTATVDTHHNLSSESNNSCFFRRATGMVMSLDTTTSPPSPRMYFLMWLMLTK